MKDILVTTFLILLLLQGNIELAGAQEDQSRKVQVLEDITLHFSAAIPYRIAAPVAKYRNRPLDKSTIDAIYQEIAEQHKSAGYFLVRKDSLQLELYGLEQRAILHIKWHQ